jgi:hypothetical protein
MVHQKEITFPAFDDESKYDLLLYFFLTNSVVLANEQVLFPKDQPGEFTPTYKHVTDFLQQNRQKRRLIIFKGLPASRKTSNLSEVKEGLAAIGEEPPVSLFDKARGMLINLWGKPEVWQPLKRKWTFCSVIQLKQLLFNFTYPKNEAEYLPLLAQEYEEYDAFLDRYTTAVYNHETTYEEVVLNYLLTDAQNKNIDINNLGNEAVLGECVDLANVDDKDRGRLITRILALILNKKDNPLHDQVAVLFHWLVPNPKIQTKGSLERSFVTGTLYEPLKSREKNRKFLTLPYTLHQEFKTSIKNVYYKTHNRRLITRIIAKYHQMANEGYIETMTKEALDQAERQAFAAPKAWNQVFTEMIVPQDFDGLPPNQADDMSLLAAFMVLRDWMKLGLASSNLMVTIARSITDQVLEIDLGFTTTHLGEVLELPRSLPDNQPNPHFRPNPELHLKHPKEWLDPEDKLQIYVLCLHGVFRSQAFMKFLKAYAGLKAVNTAGVDVKNYAIYKRKFKNRPGPHLQEFMGQYTYADGTPFDMQGQTIHEFEKRDFNRAHTVIVLCKPGECPYFFSSYPDKVIYGSIEDPEEQGEEGLRHSLDQVELLAINFINGNISVDEEGRRTINVLPLEEDEAPPVLS